MRAPSGFQPQTGVLEPEGPPALREPCPARQGPQASSPVTVSWVGGSEGVRRGFGFASGCASTHFGIERPRSLYARRALKGPGQLCLS